MTTLFPVEPHTAVCSRCGRPLTDPESIARGIGPVCLGPQPKPPAIEHPTLPGFDEPRESIAALLREAIGLLADNHAFVARAEKALEGNE